MLSLNLTTATISGMWKVVPQELIDRIIFMLGNDLRSLKALSLTCKVMFVSTRHIIHRRMSLTLDKNWELLTASERLRYTLKERQELAVGMLSRFAAHNLLPYVRYLSINVYNNFTPDTLQPFNYHFQCLDRIQELSVHRLDTPGFLESFDTYFTNFVPTLRSLQLNTPTGDTQDILDFVCQFPHLDDLTLNTPAARSHWGTWRPTTVKSIPPFRGRLKLGGITEWNCYLVQQLFSLPGKRCFRFTDFRNCESTVKQSVVDASCGTLESVSTTWNGFGRC